MTQNPKLRGLITTLLIWVAPALTCPLRADEPFDYFHNSWTVIGLKDYAHGTRITPDNQLIIHDSNGKPSRVLIRFGQQLNPFFNSKATRQQKVGKMASEEPKGVNVCFVKG
ncbi:MAG: hypothetical protein HQ580_18015 [Planctomycetes bacterium]|nr:hypothetical protein [Planctomycetota bacterium]